jgi:predicted naringenin-chalcone synthase
MPSLLSLERYLPPYRYHQREVTEWVRQWLASPPEADVAPETAARSERLLSVYETSGVVTRASVVPIEEVFHRATSRPRTRGTARSPAARAPTWRAGRSPPPASSLRRSAWS